MISDYARPVLLQQLLRAMQDESAPRSKAVVFAFLSLLVGLVACQSSVFSLWFSRRSYERSRGEMITMLYEKTLSRKILGESVSSTNSISGDDNDDGSHDSDLAQDALEGHSHYNVSTIIRKLGRLVRKYIWKSAKIKAKEPASIGKIYNLMRFVVYPNYSYAIY